MPLRFVAELLDVGRRRFRLEQRVVDHPGEVIGRDRRRRGRCRRLVRLEQLPHAVGDALKVFAREIHVASGSACHQRLALDVADHVHAPLVPLRRARGRQKDIDDGLRLVRRHLAQSKRQDVGAVVLTAVAGERLAIARRREHVRHLVGGHRRADAGAVHDDAEIAGSGAYEPRHGFRENRVVDRLRTVRAAVPYLVPLTLEVHHELLFQVETAVVGAQGDAKRLRHAVRGYQTRDCQR